MKPAPCAQAWLIEAIRDGRVIGAERASFARHQALCRACRNGLSDALALRSALDQLPSGLPDAFTVRRQRAVLLRTFDASLT